MPTARELINKALKACGAFAVGQTPTAEDTNDAFSTLNFMLSQWSSRRWLVYVLDTVQVNSTGAQYYTIGPTGQLATLGPQRPNKIYSAYFVQQNQPGQPVSYGLAQLMSREDYNRITLKTLQTFSGYFFYDTSLDVDGNGRVFVWPVLQAGMYTLFVTIPRHLNTATSLETELNLPQEYGAAIYYNLARRLRVDYQLGPDGELNRLAQDALMVMRSSNAQIPRVALPVDVIRPGFYNIFSDQTY